MTSMRGKPHGKRLTIQGAELIDLVIDRVGADPHCISGFCGDHPLPHPRPLAPEVIAQLTFPSGKPLPPSLKRWLAPEDSGYRVTDAGRAIREMVERQTDSYFYAP